MENKDKLLSEKEKENINSEKKEKEEDNIEDKEEIKIKHIIKIYINQKM